ncbi:MAG: GNAT family N-acetyltransferase [Desulfuromonadales bacterium]|nr:GNAT family N-acetyltransferase [Desulfuromonadales bacterium]
MQWHSSNFPYIKRLNQEYENAIRQSTFLNIDSLLIPSPYILDKAIDIDYEHSLVWDEEGELLGYVLVYSNPGRTKFHIYKQATSPFGRGKGIGSAFLEYLAHTVAADSRIYLFVWEKLISSIEFFQSKGLVFEDVIVYRKMKFNQMSATADTIRNAIALTKNKDYSVVEELGKIRHDAKKSLKVLFDMVSMLSVDNFNKVTEDINRETTALVNTLNTYEDKIKVSHKVPIKELIIERLIPYIEAATVPCEIRLNMDSRIPAVMGNYMNFSRALINIVSNALDAIRMSERKGVIEFTLRERDESLVLTIQDNGVGIAEELLKKGPDMLPLFVGKTTKEGAIGEGIGTRQIYATFGPDNIRVESRWHEFTRWTIVLKKGDQKDTALLTSLGSRYIRFIKSTQKISVTKESSRSEIAIFIWQLRQMELFSYDLAYQFSKYNNVRDIYQNILLYRYGGRSFAQFKGELRQCRIDHEIIASWLMGLLSRISRNETWLNQNTSFHEYKDELLQSYGQAIDRTMIFTLDPEDGRFFATDRRFAEHLDFVSYLGRERDQLIRGEFVGDLNNITSPIVMGVWTVKDRQDLHNKLLLIQKCARQFLEMGLNREKRVSFYSTTYNYSDRDIDTFKTITLQDMATMKEDDFGQLIKEADNEMGGLIFAAG